MLVGALRPVLAGGAVAALLVLPFRGAVERVDGPIDAGFDRPHQVDGTWLAIEGRGKTCALRSDGGVWCWDVSERQAPTQVARFPGATALATGGGEYLCALVGARVWCRGGPVPLHRRHVDEPVAIPEPVVAIAGAFLYVCARAVSGTVYCWEPGRGDALAVPHRSGSGIEPEPMIAELPPVQALALGAQTGCALADGRALCFGDLDFSRRFLPTTEVAAHARAVSVGRDQRCVATDDDIACTLRLPTSIIDDAPRTTTTHHAGRATALAGAEHTTCALSDHGVSCWHGTAAAHAIDVADATAVAVGDFEACALTSAGALSCWSWTR